MTFYRSILKQVLPLRVLDQLRNGVLLTSLFKNIIYDFRRYSTFSRLFGENTQEKLRASICAHYHVLEKGISMPERRSVFGIDIANSLVKKLELWRQRNYGDDIQITSAYVVLQRYLECIGDTEIPQLLGVREFMATGIDLRFASAIGANGGAACFIREDYLEATHGDFSQLVTARRSIRHYSTEPVDLSVIEEAVRLAQQSPSVCNRQGAKVWWVLERKKVDEILALQNGNRGFGHLAQALLIVTCDLSIFEGSKERNQAFIDGGLFAMSLLYGLTYKGLGACPLNWCVDATRDKELHRVTNIPKSNQVIMLISVGHLPDKFSVAVSQRHELKDVLCPIK